ncbi:hypothetical protein DESC_700001 [Desulfosarcina cetonica]|nr:hypothetical protein DESC_700001 [Desulfosarcina cetonica]
MSSDIRYFYASSPYKTRNNDANAVTLPRILWKMPKPRSPGTHDLILDELVKSRFR